MVDSRVLSSLVAVNFGPTYNLMKDADKDRGKNKMKERRHASSMVNVKSEESTNSNFCVFPSFIHEVLLLWFMWWIDQVPSMY